MVRPILEYGAACWNTCREGQKNYCVQTRGVQFTYLTKDSEWETLTQRKAIARLCALFKAYSEERALKAIHERLQRAYCLGRVDHVRKIRGRKQRTDIGKYSFVNGTIKNGNQIPAKRSELSLVNLKFLGTELGKQL